MGREERGRTQEKDSERIRKGAERALEQKDGRSIDR